MKQGFVVKAGTSRFNETTKIGGLSPVAIKVSQKDTDGTLSIWEDTGHAKGGPPLYIQPHHDEIFIVLDGEYLFQIEQEKHHLTAGDTVFIPRTVPHASAQLSEKGRYLCIGTPSGNMEDFFRALTLLPATGQPTPDQMGKLFETHGIQIVGPPLLVN